MFLSKASTGLVLVLCGTASATAPDLSTRHVLTLSAAKRVIAAAEAEAQAHGWPCVVAVTDAEEF